MSRWGFLLAAAAFAVPACGGDRSAPKTEPPQVQTNAAPVQTVAPDVRVSPPRDLSVSAPVEVFRAEAGGFVGASRVYSAKVSSGGALELAPRSRQSPVVGTPLRIAPATLRRGGRAMPGVDRTSLDDAGALTSTRGEIRERLEALAEGIEQSWTFARAPSGAGDLTVEIPVKGHRFVGTTPLGVHFADPVTGLGVRYGAIAWVDATGRRTPIEPTWTGDRIAIRVPGDVVDASRYPAVLDPLASPEETLDAPTTGGAVGSQNLPQVASDGTDYLSVWIDNRAGRPAVYGARIKADGTVLDPTGILIARPGGAATTYYSLSVAVAWSGASYFVAWTVDSDDETIPEGVFGRRITPAGSMVDDQPLTLATGSRDPQTVSIAANGAGGYLVAWRTYVPAQGYNVVGTRVDATGKPDAAPIAIAVTTEYEYDPAIDWDGTNWFVVWRSSTGGMYGARVSPAGTLVDATRITLAASAGSIPAVAFDGTDTHMVVWWIYRGSPTLYDVVGVRVGKDGTNRDPVTPLTLSATNSYEYYPSIVWDGTSFVLAWYTPTTPYNIEAKRVTRDGVAVDANPFVVSNAANSRVRPRVATSASNTIAVWYDNRDSAVSDYDIYAGRIAKATTQTALDPVAGIRVSASSNAQTAPALAWDGTNYFVVWLDTKNNERALYGLRLGPDGKPLAQPATPVRITPTGVTVQGVHHVAYGAGYYVVLWTRDYRTLSTTRITAAGVVDAQIADIYQGLNEQIYTSDIASDGTGFLAVFHRYDFQTGIEAIAGLRLAPNGLPLAPDAGAPDASYVDAGADAGPGARPIDGALLAISPATPNKRRVTPSIAFDGTNYLVTWGTTSTSSGLTHIYGTRVDKAGQALDLEVPYCTAFLQQRNPHVAADSNGGFFVTWQDYRSDVNNADVYGQRVNAAGQALDGTAGIKITGGAPDESLPKTVSAGRGTYAVVWADNRTPGGYDLYSAWVNSEGRVLDPTGYAISAEQGDETAAAVAGPNSGQFVVAYQRLDPAPSFGNWRTRVRSVQSGGPDGNACTSPGDCFSRFCVDGVCCSSACDEGCGVCNATPGTCTPKPRGPSPKCEAYVCDGTSLKCPDKCKINEDCANNTICDTGIGRCVSTVLCTDVHTLRDVTGKTTDCAPYLCQGSACMTSCRNVDDCLRPNVCDPSGKCVAPPAASDADGCSTSSASGGGGAGSSSVAWMAALAAMVGAAFARRRRSR
jgi:MYXO-CTERM domain-containing protein